MSTFVSDFNYDCVKKAQDRRRSLRILRLGRRFTPTERVVAVDSVLALSLMSATAHYGQLQNPWPSERQLMHSHLTLTVFFLQSTSYSMKAGHRDSSWCLS